jgi:hypothetical protein
MIGFLDTKLTKLGHRSWRVDVIYGELVLHTEEFDTKAKAEHGKGLLWAEYHTVIRNEQDFWSRDHSDCATTSRGIGTPVACSCPVRDEAHLHSWYAGMAGTTTTSGLEVTEDLIRMLIRTCLPYAHDAADQTQIETLLLHLKMVTEGLERMVSPSDEWPDPRTT